MRDFEEHHLDQNLGFRPVQIGDDLRNVSSSVRVGDDDKVAVLIDRDDGVSDLVVGILAGGAARTVLVPPTLVASAEARKLRVGLKRGAAA